VFEYTKGFWHTEIKPTPGEADHLQVVSAQPGKTIFIADCGADGGGPANATLICSAVNACTELNPSDPMAVCQNINELYRSLNELVVVLKDRRVGTLLNSISAGWGSLLGKAQQVLAATKTP